MVHHDAEFHHSRVFYRDFPANVFCCERDIENQMSGHDAVYFDIPVLLGSPLIRQLPRIVAAGQMPTLLGKNYAWCYEGWGVGDGRHHPSFTECETRSKNSGNDSALKQTNAAT